MRFAWHRYGDGDGDGDCADDGAGVAATSGTADGTGDGSASGVADAVAFADDADVGCDHTIGAVEGVGGGSGGGDADAPSIGGSVGNDGRAVCEASIGWAFEMGGSDSVERLPDAPALPETGEEPKPLQPVSAAKIATLTSRRGGGAVIEKID